MDVTKELKNFRNEFWRCWRSGLKFTGKLPPMATKHAVEAHNNATRYYWQGHGWGTIKDTRKLLEETRGAIAAARAEFDAAKPSRTNPNRRQRLRRMLRERDGDQCWVCKGKLHSNETIEHKVALANGGTWAFDNLVLAHAECNKALGRLSEDAKEAVRKTIGTDNER